MLAVAPNWQCQKASFTVTTISHECKSNKFFPQVTWQSTGTTTIEQFERVLKAKADSFKLSDIVSVMESCTDFFYFVQIFDFDQVLWTDYSGSIVKIDKKEREVTISTSYEHADLIGKTLRFKILITSIESLSEALNPATLEISVLLVDPCFQINI